MSSRISRPAPRGSVDVLVIDIDQARGNALATELSSHDLSSLVCDSTENALARVSAASVLLLRRRLGDTDAFAFARTLRKKFELPPRILILADAPNAEDALRAIDVSALGIVFEPRNTKDLVRRIRKAAETERGDLIEAEDAPVFRIRRGGVVFKMRARPELLVDYLLQATESLGALSPDTFPPPLTAAPSSSQPLLVDAVVTPAAKASAGDEKPTPLPLRDVAELRSLESQLRLSNEILDRVPAIVLVADPEGRVAYAASK